MLVELGCFETQTVRADVKEDFFPVIFTRVSSDPRSICNSCILLATVVKHGRKGNAYMNTRKKKETDWGRSYELVFDYVI